MEKFEEWMGKKGYPKNWICSDAIDDGIWETEPLSKQMLIGYILEYLREHHKTIPDPEDIWNEANDFIDAYYEALVFKIKEN